MSKAIISNDGKVIIEAPNGNDWSLVNGKLTDKSIFFKNKSGIFSFEFDEKNEYLINDVKKNKLVVLSYRDKNETPVIDEVVVEIEL